MDFRDIICLIIIFAVVFYFLFIVLVYKIKSTFAYIPGKKNRLFFVNLANTWRIENDSKLSSIISSYKFKGRIKRYTIEHFDLLFYIISSKISEMDTLDRVKYLNYVKYYTNILGKHDAINFVIGVLVGSSSMIKALFDSTKKPIEAVALFLLLVFGFLGYIFIINSPKIEFYKNLISALEEYESKVK